MVRLPACKIFRNGGLRRHRPAAQDARTTLLPGFGLPEFHPHRLPARAGTALLPGDTPRRRTLHPAALSRGVACRRNRTRVLQAAHTRGFDHGTRVLAPQPRRLYHRTARTEPLCRDARRRPAATHTHAHEADTAPRDAQRLGAPGRDTLETGLGCPAPLPGQHRRPRPGDAAVQETAKKENGK